LSSPAGLLPPATIYAPATAAGRAAVGIVRVSGPEAAAACRALARGFLPAPRRATLRRLVDPADGGPIDDAVLLWMPGPASLTGEDVIEFQHHGGAAVLQLLLVALGRLPGLRLAEPGEFVRRAFLNGRLDLTGVEALADLIDAGTRAQARQALRQLDGAHGRLYAGWRERALGCLALIEAEIDFAGEGDVPDATLARVLPEAAAVRAELEAHLTDGRRGERLRGGLVVAVVGAPNAGKSSLVNLLAGRDVAIVTPVPGTTRDVLEVRLDLEGLPVTLLDTAGLRDDAADPVEIEGVVRARRRAAEADLRLGVLDATAPRPDTVEGAEIVTANKSDLARAAAPDGAVAISCLTGAGIDRLLDRLAEAARGLVATSDAPVVTRARHREALTEAALALGRLAQAAEAGLELALLAEELRAAARQLGRVTGAVAADDVLDRIFATFCIGK
jgi:tRNA modification GTPase